MQRRKGQEFEVANRRRSLKLLEVERMFVPIWETDVRVGFEEFREVVNVVGSDDEESFRAWQWEWNSAGKGVCKGEFERMMECENVELIVGETSWEFDWPNLRVRMGFTIFRRGVATEPR